LQTWRDDAAKPPRKAGLRDSKLVTEPNSLARFARLPVVVAAASAAGAPNSPHRESDERERIISHAVLIFVRAPVAGRVKTRLAAEIGAGPALRVYRRLAEHAVAEARALGDDAAVRIHFTPADEGDAVRAWLGGGAEYLPQGDGGLGERMRAAFRVAFAAGFRRVVIIGSDLPDLSAAVLRDAFARLETSDAVLGPARDGGYYLLGMGEMIGGIFDDVPWSTPRVLEATLARLRATRASVAMLGTLADVDEAADLPAGWREWALGAEVSAA
jgi:rSAM/selenodomain-associated transferase 1